MQAPRRLFNLRVILPIVLLAGLAGPASAQSGADSERAEVVRQLNESRQRVRDLEEKLRQLELRRAQTAAPSLAAAANSCGIPFTLSVDGVKRLRPECVAAESGVSCESTPFSLDADGIKRVRAACNR